MTSSDLLVGKSKADVGIALCQTIVSIAKQTVLEGRERFSIALSGGSVPELLTGLPAAFQAAQTEPHWAKWHVFLCDERCVLTTSEDSNQKAIQEHFVNNTSIPTNQVYGINQGILTSDQSRSDKIEAIVADYEKTLQQVLGPSGFLDLAILGFGPDGHTCSLFPQHALLLEDTKWVAGLTDSPKPPPDRITLTLPFLNHQTRHAIVCGAGDSKRDIVDNVFLPHSIYPFNSSTLPVTVSAYTANITEPPPYPCAMVQPIQTLTWIVDQVAVPSTFGLLSNVVAQISISPNKEEVAKDLCQRIVKICQESIRDRGIFTIAVSGGSLPSLLSKLPQAFEEAGVDPQYSRWHVILADERGVPPDHQDSNVNAIKRYLLNQRCVSIPVRQVYGIDMVSLSESIQVAAADYQNILMSVLQKAQGYIDLALLGFGPDGHTCSLFPGHELLLERHLFVAGLSDSPKPPNQRITLTLRTLNERTRHVFFCGMGESKSQVLREVLQAAFYTKGSPSVQAHVYPKYPCGMVRPQEQLVYIADEEAMKNVYIASNEDSADHDILTNTGPRLMARQASSILPKPKTAKVIVRDEKDNVARELCNQIIRYSTMAIKERGAFTVALSGGSLPSMLSKLPDAFKEAGVNPNWHLWHILLADERCVPGDHPDSNMHAIRRFLLDDLYEQIIHQHIYSIDQISVAKSADIVAQNYERQLRSALDHSKGMLDLAVLGFGPDGHTCSLFPGHPLLREQSRWVAPITNSPKPPSRRITLTFPVFNEHTRNILVCGTGDSKHPILKEIFRSVQAKGLHLGADVNPKYPCAMVRPRDELVYLVDSSAYPEASSAALAAQFARVLVAPSKSDIPNRLHALIIQQSQKAIRARGVFSIALSGGSLPSLLTNLGDSFNHFGVDPQWDKWHILLADERCVPLTDDDSNLGAMKNSLLDHIAIPREQVHGIDESLLEQTASMQARAYESKVRDVLAETNGMLDVALLGFGPDGHTCSLFPDHSLLQEDVRYVAGIEDSPKPPPKRITLTFAVLNEFTRTAIFCGAGASKEPILSQVFGRVEGRHGADCHVRMRACSLPCSRVAPKDHLYWVIDADAMPKGLAPKSSL